MMSRRLDEDDEEICPARHSERELTLGTGAILGIFFGLVALVGLSIGFGYKLGSAAKNAGTLPADVPAPPIASTSTNFNAFKPAAGSPAGAENGSTAPGIAVREGNLPTLTVPAGAPVHASAPQPVPPAPSETETPRAGTPVTLLQGAPAATPPPPAPGLLAPAASTVGPFVVQVAAVSHQEDADLLINALHAKGYAVSARSEGDRLVHIQVGPFPNRSDANAMKARLSADGYNAYIK